MDEFVSQYLNTENDKFDRYGSTGKWNNMTGSLGPTSAQIGFGIGDRFGFGVERNSSPNLRITSEEKMRRN